MKDIRIAIDGIVAAESVAQPFSTCLEELDAYVDDDFSLVDFSLSSPILESFLLDEDLTTLLVEVEEKPKDSLDVAVLLPPIFDVQKTKNKIHTTIIKNKLSKTVMNDELMKPLFS